jgi:hypothetical protein
LEVYFGTLNINRHDCATKCIYERLSRNPVGLV